MPSSAARRATTGLVRPVTIAASIPASARNLMPAPSREWNDFHSVPSSAYVIAPFVRVPSTSITERRIRSRGALGACLRLVRVRATSTRLHDPGRAYDSRSESAPGRRSDTRGPWVGCGHVDASALQTVGVIGGLIFSVAFHETAHAWTAYRLGDPTGKLLGRITLNPIPHIDLFGTIILPVALWLVSRGNFLFGYAKPVPYDPRYLKNPVVGSALISAAGPLSNLLLSV